MESYWDQPGTSFGRVPGCTWLQWQGRRRLEAQQPGPWDQSSPACPACHCPSPSSCPEVASSFAVASSFVAVVAVVAAVEVVLVASDEEEKSHVRHEQNK